ncbi:MAG: insulinase family protein [Oscillospiraceae bacterium]|nr:insulinase family protein [Oscillospiraceae bacterium]
MRMTRRELAPGVNLTCVTGNRYKTNVMTAYLLRPLDSREAALNALLPQVLRRGSRKRPDLRRLSEALDDLYGASMAAGVRKIGEWHAFGLSADFIGDAFCGGGKGAGQTSGMAELLTETLLCPAVRDGVFDYVESERDKLADAIRALKNDKTSYAVRRLEALACGGEPYGVGELGDERSVSEITPESLWEHYQRSLAASRLELFYCGCSENAAELLTGWLDRRYDGFRGGFKGRVCDRPQAPFVTKAAEARAFTERMDVTQTKLALLWRTGTAADGEGFMASYLAQTLYGGGTTSKLFLNVRERLSLCYYAMSALDRHKGVMKAMSGVESVNAERARDEMLRQWDDVAAGRFTDKDMAGAKAALVNAWRKQCDSPGGLERFWQGQAAAGLTGAVGDWEAELDGTGHEDVVRAAKNFTLDSVYMMIPDAAAGGEAAL